MLDLAYDQLVQKFIMASTALSSRQQSQALARFFRLNNLREYQKRQVMSEIAQQNADSV